MDDTIFTYREDLKEKSHAAKGAYHKSHRGSKYMRTPSDYLTKKERNKMNGEVSTYRIAPMSWPDFMKIPDDIQREYLQTLFEKFGVSVNRLAKMFGVSFKTVSKRIEFLRVKIKTSNGFNQPAWDDWLNSKKDIIHVDGFAGEESKISPISYASLKKFVPIPERKAYIEYIFQKFGIGPMALAKYWGANPSTLYSNFKNWGVDFSKKNSNSDAEAFENWFGSCEDAVLLKNDELAEATSVKDAEEIREDSSSEESKWGSASDEADNTVVYSGSNDFEGLEALLNRVKTLGGKISIVINI